MTARSIRRAAERKAAKLALKEARHFSDSSPIETGIAPARLEANRANAQFSTGPRTPAGKAASSLNAVKTGLTGHTVLLSSDNVPAYRNHLAAYARELQPVGLRERELVQSIADSQWRLERIPALELAIYAKGHDELAGDYLDLPEETRAARIEVETYLRYEKSLRNLHLQEGRLRRQRARDMAELKALQAERKAEEQESPKSVQPLASFLQQGAAEPNLPPPSILPVPPAAAREPVPNKM